LAALAVAVLIFFLRKGSKDAASVAEQLAEHVAVEVPTPIHAAPSVSTPNPVAPAAKGLVRRASPQIQAMIRDFKLARSADLSKEDATSIVRLLSRIPRPPSALHKLVSPEFLASANTAELSDMVMAEPQIAAKVLVMVNSPFYGLKAPLTSIGQAVTFLGMNTVRSVCLQHMLDESFQSKDPDVKKVFEALWNASAFASELCFKLAQMLQLPEPGTLVTQVVLSFLGHVASHSLLPRDQVLPMMAKGMLERARVEQSVLGLSAAEIGSLLMREWELPASIVDSVRDIDLVLATPCDPSQEQRSARMAFCYVCARLGERLAYGEIKDLSEFQLEQEQSVEFFHLHSYLQLPALARLNEYLHSPHITGSIHTMLLSMQVRK
jgi:HD-like signal output (HDOD) protein